MDLFSNLKAFFKPRSTTIDNNVFRLHYKATSVVLAAFSILVTARQYIGDPIDCISKDDVPNDVLDTFCWVHGTFSLPDAWNKTVGYEVPYPGVDKYVPGARRVYHSYYQWVCFVLLLQAILFYVPRYFWKSIEGGRVKNLILGLNSPIMSEELKKTNKRLLVDYMVDNVDNHKAYFLGYVGAEVLNFINVVGQMLLIDAFLGGEFSRYGLEVIQFTGWDGSLRFDPMIKVFPRMTKCTFHRYGSSGDVMRYNAMCILPINIINEKIYIFIWFWFIILAVMSSLVLVYRGVLIYWPKSRFFVTSSRCRLVSLDHLEMVLNHLKLGDWFLLDMLCKNLDSVHFRDVVQDLAKKFEEKNFEEFYRQA